jgi:hypothetical protein
MDKHITIDVLQKALTEKYNLSENHEKNVLSSTMPIIDEGKTKLQQLKPLLLIIFYITTASVLFHYKIGKS